ncbi:hypothetical protein CDO73_03590 [Saccharibacillus sp. O23]|uniref:stalk domain-containing protein n=1 Tax=Saccharibacillus sp. O23 TaxID=2009338 RepID=UPI000B4DFB65|nr:hypothetical protein [Saccharibacillus sp. O23]OWR32695.1 hypothetical protein CDO73_03590 [Saccharibacillus sp. O23]
MIGQKVQSVFSLEKDGKKIAEAVAINGATYAPVRAIAEATGTSLKVEGKTITMSDKDKATASTTVSNDETPVNIQIMAKQNKIDALNRDIESAKRGKQAWADMLEPGGAVDPDSPNANQVRKRMAECDERIAAAEAEIAQLQAEIAALQQK